MQSVSEARLSYKPTLPEGLTLQNFKLTEGAPTTAVADADEIAKEFPNTYGQKILTIEADNSPAPERPAVKIGVILSGGQAPGGHNVITGLYDRLKQINKDSTVIGFLMGPDGLIKNEYMTLTDEVIDAYRNQGGFHMIQSGRTKIAKEDQFKAVINTVTAHELDGLVVIGGDDSNTNAAVLAERFAAEGLKTKVIGCPKTIDGDLKSLDAGLEVSFGFDSACKVYSELIGNIMMDCLSARKYYHLVRLMGRSASHIALECALETRPNACLIGEEVAEKNMTTQEIVNQLADIICDRANQGKNYGVFLVPEGLLEFIPEFTQLMESLSTIMGLAQEKGTLPAQVTPEWIKNQLSGDAKQLEAFEFLPKIIQEQLCLERDPHGNIQVSRIETEKFLVVLLEEELARRKAAGNYSGKFNALTHFFGYEGRAVNPSNFDAKYCYALGQVAGILISQNKTGYLAVVNNVAKPTEQWEARGLPITSLFNMEVRHGHKVPVIQKYLVDLNGKPYQYFVSKRAEWAHGDCFENPGPIQYWGPCSERVNESCMLEAQ